MTKTKYLLYSFKQPKNKKYIYWYETDKKYFRSTKPPKKILENNPQEKSTFNDNEIIDNPWLQWQSNNIQMIVSKKGNVCLNYLRSTDNTLIGKEEDLKLLEMYSYLVANFDISKAFGFKTVKKWHKTIFQSIYPFAGDLRNVNMSKGSGSDTWEWKLSFLNAIPEFDTFLKKVSAKKYTNIDEITLDISKLICDFLFIHPFREGNGRLSRLIGDIILAKNGWPMIGLKLKKADNYIQRVHEGYSCNYEPMCQLLKEKLEEEIKNE